MESNRAITLQDLQALLGSTIRCNPDLQGVWVTAELSDLRVTGGHCYMELVEKDTSGNTRAKMRAMIWSSSLAGIRYKFQQATGKDIATGYKVMVCGSVNHHPVYGLSFTISDIDPTYTIGDIERLRREILERLAREGILNNNKELSFPYLPQRIAVISAAGAAGYGDFINQLEGSAEGFKFYPYLFPAVMQGERTASSVTAALEKIETTIDLWDCVVIIRGGGATTDLTGFDDYGLAKAVATFRLPIIVGIGHERDRTVLDEIARIRCKTPTAVAGGLIDCARRAYSDMMERVEKISHYSADALKGEKYRLDNIEATLPARVQTGILRAEKYLDEITHSMERALSQRAGKENERLRLLGYRLERACLTITEKPMLKLKNIEDMIRLLSPQNTLKRGYSITYINGKAATSAKDLKPGDIIETRLFNGTVESEVRKMDNEVDEMRE